MANTFEPNFTITNRIAAGLTKIEGARGFLEAAKLTEDWVREMGRRAFILEAHHTTHIEGTHLTLEQAEQLLNGDLVPEADPDDVQELLNYRKAFYVVISVTGETIYTPPPAHEVPIMMEELVGWLNEEQNIHPVLVSGISQFQLVHIHPFLDGNGRTSRLLSTLALYRAGYDFKRLFAISEYYDRDRPAFYRAIQRVRENDMDMTGWLEYFVEGLTAQLTEVRVRGELTIRRDVLTKEHGLSDRQTKALGYILEHGSLSIQDFESLCPDTNRRTLQRDLKAMADQGLIVSEGKTHQLRYRLAGGT